MQSRWGPHVLAVVVGIAAELAAWLGLDLWDLSEVDTSGRHIAGGGDHLAPRIGAALALLTAVYCAIVLVAQRLPILWAASGSCVTWVALWAWRSSAARVDGANLWPVGLVVVMIPAAFAALGAVIGCSILRERFSRNRPAGHRAAL